MDGGDGRTQTKGKVQKKQVWMELGQRKRNPYETDNDRIHERESKDGWPSQRGTRDRETERVKGKYLERGNGFIGGGNRKRKTQKERKKNKSHLLRGKNDQPKAQH